MKFEKGSREWAMFKDIWTLACKWWEVPNTDEKWDECIKEVDAFCKKYSGKDMVGTLSLKFGMALCESLSEEYKRQKTLQNVRIDT